MREWIDIMEGEDYLILYHGTSESADLIHRDGLIGGRHQAVFLTDNPELAVDYAQSDQERTGNENITIISVPVNKLDQSLLGPDVDHTGCDSWEESLGETDQCMYFGNIPPEWISIEEL